MLLDIMFIEFYVMARIVAYSDSCPGNQQSSLLLGS